MRAPVEVAPPPGLPADHWSHQIDDEGARQVLLHLEQFGSVSDDAIASFTGGPRQARAFANKLDQYRPLLPFGVDLDTQSGQKIYRKK